MASINAGSQITRDNAGRAPIANPRGGLAWTISAFGIIIGGLVGGAVLSRNGHWAWILLLADFVGYVLAFRRGMLLWNPDIDRTWRHSLWLDGGMRGERDQAFNGLGGPFGARSETLRTVRREPPLAPRPELSVVR